MTTTISDCFRRFGHADFDAARLDKSPPTKCPVQGCSTSLVGLPYGKQEDREGNHKDRTLPWCPEHGIRLHSGTFVYWNGEGREDDSRLRNFIVRPKLVRAVAFPKGMKAESHRLGYEMSEDALSWNVFVSLAEAGRLRQAAELLTGRSLRSEPDLYLWGRRIDLAGGNHEAYPALLKVRTRLEPDIHTFVTEPDIMLVARDEMIIGIEAKFGSGNPLAHDSPQVAGAKPTTREDLLARYLGPTEYAKRSVRPDQIGLQFHSQLFRSTVFACEMAGELQWHVVNLVSSTQGVGADDEYTAYTDPTLAVCEYLHPDAKHCFTYRTWEGLHAAVIRNDPKLVKLNTYLQNKSAHYRRAFQLS